MHRTIILFFIIGLTSIFPQENSVSEAYKKSGFTKRSSLIQPKYPTYSLAANYILTEKAKSGDPFAQHELGIRYILGVGVPIDTVEAAYWIGKAAAKNLPAANFNYGIMLNSGIGTEWNPFKAFKNFKIAAESGMEQGQYVIGVMYTDNLIVNKNFKVAQKWLEKSAEKGFEEAIKVLDELKKQGLIVNPDSLSNNKIETEISNFASISSSIISNDYELDFYNFSEDSLNEDEERGILNNLLSSKKDELKKKLKINESDEYNQLKDTSSINLIDFAALKGSPEALLIKGRLFELGLGVKQNYILASSNYLKAFRLGSYKAAESLLKISQKDKFFNQLEVQIKNNNPDAMYVWAGIIALGLDYSLTEKQAFELLQKAEKQNHINSIIELGLAYYSGSLVKKDSLKAIEYLKTASKLGSNEAKIRLAFISLQSLSPSIKTNYIKVLQTYSQDGSVLAEAALAFCYENGLGVNKNKAKAVKLYRQAAQRGNEAAYNSLRNMYDQLRPDEEEFQIYF